MEEEVMSEKKKKQTMVYLNKENVALAKELGLNISQIAGSALEYVLKEQSFQPVYTEIKLLSLDIDMLVMRKDLRQKEIKDIDRLFEETNNRRDLLLKHLDTSEKDTRVAKLFAQMRDISSSHNYNIDKIWDTTEDIRLKLSDEGYDWSREDLKTFITRIQE